MKEILYVQAGELSNYAGTHFWNTQESYLQSDESQDCEIEPSISFCESVDLKNRSTLCPRLIMLDRKSNFGTLGNSNALGSFSDDDDGTAPALWGGNLVEYRQDRIAKSSYHTHLEAAESQISKPSAENVDMGDIRYWSDFSRVYYLPKSLQKLPDPPDWETATLDWNKGQESFTRLNEETELMDGTLRLFVEDCDNIQGVQIMNDTETFGAFMSSFLVSFRDEYHKLPSFTFPVLSGVASPSHDINETKHIRQLVNEALYLRTLNESSSMNIPINKPALWDRSLWGSPLNFPSSSIYHQSAVLSAHVETVTFPFRMNHKHHDMSTACGRLNWRGASPFGELSGLFPVAAPNIFENNIINFSSDLPAKSSDQYCRWDVSRGFSPQQIFQYEEWLAQKKKSLNGSYYTASSFHASAYPLPDSFPKLGCEMQTPNSTSLSNNPRTIQLYSSLASSSNISRAFEKYALFVESCIQHRGPVVASLDMSFDDLKDLANDLWTIHDNSGMENDNASSL